MLLSRLVTCLLSEKEKGTIVWWGHYHVSVYSKCKKKLSTLVNWRCLLLKLFWWAEYLCSNTANSFLSIIRWNYSFYYKLKTRFDIFGEQKWVSFIINQYNIVELKPLNFPRSYRIDAIMCWKNGYHLWERQLLSKPNELMCPVIFLKHSFGLKILELIKFTKSTYLFAENNNRHITQAISMPEHNKPTFFPLFSNLFHLYPVDYINHFISFLFFITIFIILSTRDPKPNTANC